MWELICAAKVDGHFFPFNITLPVFSFFPSIEPDLIGCNMALLQIMVENGFSLCRPQNVWLQQNQIGALTLCH